MPHPVREGGNSSQGVPLLPFKKCGDVMGRNSSAVGFAHPNGRHRYSFDLKWGEGTTLSYIGPGMACYGGLKTISANPTNIARVSV